MVVVFPASSSDVHYYRNNWYKANTNRTLDDEEVSKSSKGSESLGGEGKRDKPIRSSSSIAAVLIKAG